MAKVTYSVSVSYEFNLGLTGPSYYHFDRDSVTWRAGSNPGWRNIRTLYLALKIIDGILGVRHVDLINVDDESVGYDIKVAEAACIYTVESLAAAMQIVADRLNEGVSWGATGLYSYSGVSVPDDIMGVLVKKPGY